MNYWVHDWRCRVEYYYLFAAENGVTRLARTSDCSGWPYAMYRYYLEVSIVVMFASHHQSWSDYFTCLDLLEMVSLFYLNLWTLLCSEDWQLGETLVDNLEISFQGRHLTSYALADFRFESAFNQVKLKSLGLVMHCVDSHRCFYYSHSYFRQDLQMQLRSNR